MISEESILEILKNTDLNEKYLDVFRFKNCDAGKVLTKCGVIAQDGGEYFLTILGKWLFHKNRFSFIYYFEDTFLVDNDEKCPFEQIFEVRQTFNIFMTVFENRSRLIRQEEKEIDEKLFMSAFASVLSSTNIYNNSITIEQDNTLGVLTLAAPRDTSFRNDSLGLIKLLCFLKIIDWHYLAIIRNAFESGILRGLRNDYIKIEILYKNAKRRFNNRPDLTKTEMLVKNYISSNKKATRGDIVRDLALSTRNSSRVLDSLVDKKQIKRVGTKGLKNSFYITK